MLIIITRGITSELGVPQTTTRFTAFTSKTQLRKVVTLIVVAFYRKKDAD